MRISYLHLTRTTISVVAAVLALAGCQLGSSDSKGGSESRTGLRPTGPPFLPRVIVARDDRSLPSRCSVRVVADGVNRFLDALNRGDTRSLDQLIAERARFQWFSAGEAGTAGERDFTATGERSAGSDSPGQDQRPILLRYLAARHRRGERMRLLEVSVSRIRPRRWFPAIDEDVAGVEYTMHLDSRDFGALGGENHIASGKGGLACRDHRILAWSFGLQADSTLPPGALNPCHAKESVFRKIIGPHAGSRSPTIACG